VRVLVTGSRDWTDRDGVRAALNVVLSEKPLHEKLVVVHGACPTGADRWADEWARTHAECHDVTAERHPAPWRTAGKQAGHWRNQHMVNLGADLCLAFFQPGAANKGTADCVRKALAADIPIRPCGEIPVGLFKTEVTDG
jgi:hypothetical protein